MPWRYGWGSIAPGMRGSSTIKQIIRPKQWAHRLRIMQKRPRFLLRTLLFTHSLTMSCVSTVAR